MSELYRAAREPQLLKIPELLTACLPVTSFLLGLIKDMRN